MSMSRQFITVNYQEALETTVRLGDCLPQDHLARFIADVVEDLDLAAFYAHYAKRGAAPYAPEVLLALLVYAYANGVFSSRKIEQACKDNVPYRFLAGNLTPDHDTIANFRKTFLPQLRNIFVQILLLAQEMGLLKVGNISLDGSKIHADASKSKAVSYKRLKEIEVKLAEEVRQLFLLAEQADKSALPEGMDLPKEITRRKDRLARMAEARTVLEARAAERTILEQAEYEAKMRSRDDQEKHTGKKLPGKPPAPPTPGPRDKDQYNFTDPQSRIMKNSRDDGFDQHYNVQAAVDQEALFIVGASLSNHANDQQEAAPTLDSIPEELGSPKAAALDCGFFGSATLSTLEARAIEAYIATGRADHSGGWEAYFAEAGPTPPEGATPREKMAYKLRTALGKAIYRRRKCTIEPVFGQIKEVLGFRQFSLRGLASAAGEWFLVCLAYNLRRLHVLSNA
jgi:transposase